MVVVQGLSCSEGGGIFLGPGLTEPVSLALVGGFLTTEPLGSPEVCIKAFKINIITY